MLQQPVLTIQDYFKHFDTPPPPTEPSRPPRPPKFKYQPQLLTNEERYWLALSLAGCSQTINTQKITHHPIFRSQIRYINGEFQRLGAILGWKAEDEIYVQNRTTFDQAVKNTCWKLLGWAKRELVPDLVRFFEEFEGPDYSHNHLQPALVEFKRLCEQKKWSKEVQEVNKSKLAKILADNNTTLHRPATQATLDVESKTKNLNAFFTSFKKLHSEFVYNPVAFPPAELQRLMKTIGYKFTEEETGRIRRDFNLQYGYTDCWTFYGRTGISITASSHQGRSEGQTFPSHQKDPDTETQYNRSRPPVDEFFQRFSHHIPGYHYRRGRPTDEFPELANSVMRNIRFQDAALRWGQSIPGALIPRALTFWKSEMYRELQDKFYQAIEEQFEWHITFQAKNQGLKKHEYLVLFFELDTSGQGEKELDERHAFNLLSKVNINIYDFIDHQQALLVLEQEKLEHQTNTDPPTDNRQVIDLASKGLVVSHRDSVSSVPIKFPTIETLGIYCEITGRVYNMLSANQNGILRQLLRSVGRFFGPGPRREFFERCAADYAESRSLEDVDALMIVKIKKFYAGINPAGNPGNARPRYNPGVEKESKPILAKFRTLFEVAEAHELTRLVSKTEL